jgi:hypothetical protein
MIRSEVAQDGNIRTILYKATNGTETPTTLVGRDDLAVDVIANTAIEIDFVSGLSSGDGNISKGELIALKLQTPSAANDTNVTCVFRWDITT